MKKWSEVNKEMDDKIRVPKTRFWKEYVEEINREDSTKMWKTIKMLNEGKNNDRKNESLVVDRVDLKSDEEEAASFMRVYAEINTVS